MGREIIGSLIMALAGFLFMVAIVGGILDVIERIVFLFSSIAVFYFGMKVYRQYMPKESLGSKDWLVILLSILTPFIIISLLNSLGILFGGIGILIWLAFVLLAIFRTEKIVDILFPKIEKKSFYDKNEEMRRRLNPQLYSSRVKREKDKESD